MADRRQGRPLRALEVYSADGQRLGADDTTVRKIGRPGLLKGLIVGCLPPAETQVASARDPGRVAPCPS